MHDLKETPATIKYVMPIHIWRVVYWYDMLANIWTKRAHTHTHTSAAAARTQLSSAGVLDGNVAFFILQKHSNSRLYYTKLKYISFIFI